jgi:hypothetical protein
MCIIVFIIILVIAFKTSITSRNEIFDTYTGLGVVWLSGIAFFVALLGYLLMFLKDDKAYIFMIFAGLIVSIICSTTGMVKGVLNTDGASVREKLTYGSFSMWLRTAMYPVGVIVKIVLCCTIVGIPVVKLAESLEAAYSEMNRQEQLKMEYQAMKDSVKITDYINDMKKGG